MCIAANQNMEIVPVLIDYAIRLLLTTLIEIILYCSIIYQWFINESKVLKYGDFNAGSRQDNFIEEDLL